MSSPRTTSEPTATTSELAETFARILRPEAITTSPSELLRHGTDESWHKPAAPQLVVYAESTEDVIAVVRECARQRVPLIPFGAGTSVEGHITAPYGGISLDMSRLNRILKIRVDDLDVTVQPGVTRLQLERALGPQGLFFPVDPGADATIGGMLSTGASGTTAVGYGTMRENVLSLQVVLPSGELMRTRSRARKSSAGYDLTHLFVGAEGTLGVITEATLRAHPQPESIAAAVCTFPTLQDATTCVIEAIQTGLPLARAELLDELQMEAIRKRHQLPYPPQPTVFFEFHGSPAATAQVATDIKELTDSHNAIHLTWANDPTQRHHLWEARHHAYDATLALKPGHRAISTDVCVPISNLAECVLATRADIDQSGMTATMVSHAGDGNFHMIILIDPDDPAETETAKALLTRMVKRAIELDGTCTGEHGVGTGKRQYLLLEHDAAAINLMRELKRTIDPHNILNPGKILPPED